MKPDMKRALFLSIGILLLPAVLHAAGRTGVDDSHWAAGYSYPGIYGQVWAIASYGGALIVGGDFESADGVPVSNIAAWDGSTWGPVGPGLDDIVLSLSVYRGELIASGWFHNAGATSVEHIARWNGIEWRPLDAGLDSYAQCYTVFAGDLIVGGGFTHAGSPRRTMSPAGMGRPGPPSGSDSMAA